MKHRLESAARWGGICATVLLVIVYVANVPFYCGSAMGTNWSWRMEHGRLKVERNPVGSRESFYVAINNEGLHFAPEFRWYGGGHGMINIPMWMPLLAAGCVTGMGWMRWRKRRLMEATTKCGRCRYELKGLATGQCPECGTNP